MEICRSMHGDIIPRIRVECESLFSKANLQLIR